MTASKLIARGATGSRSPLEGEPNRSFNDFVGGYETILQQFARGMRKEQTPWERKLWAQLKNEKLGGYKFRRQQPIGSYIADFYNAEKRTIIELDGSQHATSNTDKARDEALHKLGYRVIRIWNNDIDQNLEGVLTHIFDVLHHTPHRNAQERFDSPSRGEWEPMVTAVATPAKKAKKK